MNMAGDLARPAQAGMMSVAQLLKSDAALKRFEQYAPKGVDHERLFKIFAHAVTSNPRLMEADPRELLRVAVGVAATGLEINSPQQHAFIIPFREDGGTKLQVIFGYQGLLELAYRSGVLQHVTAEVVTQEEVDLGLFDYQYGTEPFLRHKFGPNRVEGTSKPAYVYAISEMASADRGGERARVFKVLPWSAVEKIRDNSSGYRSARKSGQNSSTYLKNPWVAWEWSMAQKTVLRQQLKTIQRELGDENLSQKDADEYETKLADLGLPEEISRVAIDKLCICRIK